MKAALQFTVRILFWLSIIAFLLQFTAWESVATTTANCLFSLIIVKAISSDRLTGIRPAQRAE